MTKFIVGRSLRAFVIFMIATIVVFFGLRVAPGSVEDALINPAFRAAGSATLVENLQARLGLDKPLMLQYLIFLKNLVTLDLGISLISAKPISDIIKDAGLNTLALAGAATFLTYTLAIPLGILAAWKRNSPLDQGAMLIAVLGMGIPNFFLAILLIQWFAVDLGWLPVAGSGSFEHIVLPAAVLAAESVAINLRMMRSSLLEQLGQDYIRTLHAKGLSPRRIVTVHAVRNALPPVIALGGLLLRNLLAFTLIVEVIFRWPGLGSQIVDAVLKNDFTLAQVLSVLLILAVIFFNLLADVAHQLVDPRVRERARS